MLIRIDLRPGQMFSSVALFQPLLFVPQPHHLQHARSRPIEGLRHACVFVCASELHRSESRSRAGWSGGGATRWIRMDVPPCARTGTQRPEVGIGEGGAGTGDSFRYEVAVECLARHTRMLVASPPQKKRPAELRASHGALLRICAPCTFSFVRDRIYIHTHTIIHACMHMQISV